MFFRFTVNHSKKMVQLQLYNYHWFAWRPCPQILGEENFSFSMDAVFNYNYQLGLVILSVKWSQRCQKTVTCTGMHHTSVKAMGLMTVVAFQTRRYYVSSVRQPAYSKLCVFVHPRAPSWLCKLPVAHHLFTRFTDSAKALVPLHDTFCP